MVNFEVPRVWSSGYCAPESDKESTNTEARAAQAWELGKNLTRGRAAAVPRVKRAEIIQRKGRVTRAPDLSRSSKAFALPPASCLYNTFPSTPQNVSRPSNFVFRTFSPESCPQKSLPGFYESFEKGRRNGQYFRSLYWLDRSGHDQLSFPHLQQKRRARCLTSVGVQADLPSSWVSLPCL